MPTIRNATPEDVPALAALVGSYWEFEQIAGYSPQSIQARLRSFLSQPQLGRCWVAQYEAQLAGYLIAVRVFSLEYGGIVAELDELFVRPEHRAQGTGARLLQAAERDLAQDGCLVMQLQLGIHNDAARQFYRRFGYRPRAGYELLDKPLAG